MKFISETVLPLSQHYITHPDVVTTPCSIIKDFITVLLVSVLCVLLGGLAPSPQAPDPGWSQMTWPLVPAALYTWLPVARGWPAFGGSCHGVYKAGLPSPGDRRLGGVENTEEAAGL